MTDPAPTTEPVPTADPAPTITLTRWTVTSGSNARSRGAVVISAGANQWRASADGNGAIDALYRAVDQALAGVLAGHPRLLAYDIHALGEGTDTIGAVTVRVGPPAAEGARGTGEYAGEARGPNIIAASVEAYLEALNAMLGETHWQGAPEAAAARDARTRRGRGVPNATDPDQRAVVDEDEAQHDTTAWFER